MTERIWATTITAIVLAVASIALAQEDTSGSGAAPDTGAAASEGVLEVSEIILGSALENGVPPSPTTTFSHADSAVYCVIRLRNDTRTEGAIRVAFERAEGEPQARTSGGVRLEYPARATYRTVARTSTQRDPGSYRCVVRSEDGQVLSHADFTLGE